MQALTVRVGPILLAISSQLIFFPEYFITSLINNRRLEKLQRNLIIFGLLNLISFGNSSMQYFL